MAKKRRATKKLMLGERKWIRIQKRGGGRERPFCSVLLMFAQCGFAQCACFLDFCREHLALFSRNFWEKIRRQEWSDSLLVWSGEFFERFGLQGLAFLSLSLSLSLSLLIFCRSYVVYNNISERIFVKISRSSRVFGYLTLVDRLICLSFILYSIV